MKTGRYLKLKNAFTMQPRTANAVQSMNVLLLERI